MVLQKKFRKRPSFRTHCLFTFPLEFTDVFQHGVQVHTPQKALFHRKSYSKSRNHALEKVLTNKAPSISDSSCAAASCSPVNQPLFKAYLSSTSWCFSDRVGIFVYESARSPICGRLPPRQCSISCFSYQLQRSSAVFLFHSVI